MGSQTKQVYIELPDFDAQADLIQEGTNEAIYQLSMDIEPESERDHIIELLSQTIILITHNHHTKH